VLGSLVLFHLGACLAMVSGLRGFVLPFRSRQSLRARPVRRGSSAQRFVSPSPSDSSGIGLALGFLRISASFFRPISLFLPLGLIHCCRRIPALPSTPVRSL
jgi:hypothetical protein